MSESLYPATAGLEFPNPPEGILPDDMAAIMERRIKDFEGEPDTYNAIAGKLNEYKAFRDVYPRPITPEEDAENKRREETTFGLLHQFDVQVSGIPMETVKLAPPEKQEAEKKSIAAKGFAFYKTGRLTEGPEWEATRDALADKYLKGKGKGSDSEFAGEAGKFMIKEREALARFDEVRQAAIRDVARIEPADYQESLEKLAVVHKESEREDDGTPDKLLAFYRQVREEADRKVAPLRPVAEEMRSMFDDVMAKGRGSEDGQAALDKAIDRLASVPEEDRGLVVKMLQAKLGKEASSNTAGKSLLEGERGLIAMLRGADSTNTRYELLREKDAINSALPDAPGQSMTPEEKAAANSGLDQKLAKLDVREQVVGILEGTIDPLTAEGSLFTASSMAVSRMLGAMVPIVFPYVGLPTAIAAYTDEAYRDLKNKGVDDFTALKSSLLQGVTKGSIERLGYLGVFAPKSAVGKMVTGVGKAFIPKTPGFVTSKLYQMGRTATGIQALEYSEEIAQSAVPAFAAAVGEQLGWDLPEQARFTAEWGGLQVWQPEVFLTLLPLTMVTGGYQGLANTAQARQELAAMSGDALNLQMLRVPKDKAEMIAALPAHQRVEAYVAAQKDLLAVDSPEVTEAMALGVQRHKEAAEAQALAADRMAQEVETEGLSVSRHTDGWRVKDLDAGTETLHETPQAAMMQTRELLTEKRITKQDTFLEALDEVVANMAEGRTVVQSGKGEESLLDDMIKATKAEDTGSIAAIWDRANVEQARRGLEPIEMDMRNPASLDALAGMKILGRSKTLGVGNAAKSIATVMKQGGTGDLIEEQAEADLKENVAAGTASLAKIRQIMARIEDFTKDKYVDAETPTGIVEGWSKLVRMYTIGTKKGNKRSTGMRRELLDELSVARGEERKEFNEARHEHREQRKRLAAADIDGTVAPSAFAKFKEYYDYLRAIIGKVARLQKAQKAGVLGDLEAMIRETVGLKEQDAHEEGVTETAKVEYNLPDGWDAPDVGFSIDSRAGGVSYSIAPADAKRHGELEAKYTAGTITLEETAEAQRMVDEAAKAAGLKMLWTGRRTAPDDPLKLVGSIWDRPTWLTNERRVAARYARGAYDPRPNHQKWVKKFYVRLKNPFKFERSPEVWKYLDEQLPDEAPFTPEEESPDENAADSGVIREALQQLGHDGVHYTRDDMTGEGDYHESFLVFDPSQIKSAAPFTGVPLDQRFDPDSDSISYSIAPAAKRDAEYMAAVESGDVAKQQAMVDAEAKAARYTTEGFHGTTQEEFSVFDKRKGGEGLIAGHPIAKYGFFFSPTEAGTEAYRGKDGRTIRAYLKAKKWYNYEMFGDLTLADERGIAVDSKVRPFIEGLKAKGYDGVRMIMGNTPVELMVFNPNQIKSADPVTRDDSGNVIPLSQRFNPASDSISYSITTSERMRNLEENIVLRMKDPEEKFEMWANAHDRLAGMVRAIAYNEEQTDATPRETLLRWLNALDTILVAFPSEVRAKVGGYVQLAGLTTEAQMEKYMKGRLDKMDATIEKFLQDKYRANIAAIFDKAEVKAGPSRVPKGGLTPDAQEAIGKAEKFANLSLEDAADEIARAEAVLSQPTTDQDAHDKATDEMLLLHLFAGALDTGKGGMTAHDLAVARAWLRDTYKAGRLANAALKQALRDKWDGWRGGVIGAMGPATSDDAADRIEREKGPGIKKTVKDLSQGTFDLHQQIADILGEKNQVTRHFTTEIRRARERARWAQYQEQLALSNWMAEKLGIKSKGEQAIALSKLSKVVESPVFRTDGRVVVTDKITPELAAKLVEGTAEDSRYTPGGDAFKALGETLREYQETLEAHDTDPEAKGRRPARKYLEVERVTNPGTRKRRTMSELEAIQDLLTYRQERYQESSMERHGLGKEYIEQVLEWLSPEAVSVLGFIREQYGKGYDGMNSTFRTLFNVNMPREKNYARAAFNVGGVDPTVPGPDGLPTSPSGMSIASIKGRVAHKAEPKKANALAMRMSHVAQTSHWQHGAEVARDLLAVFSPLEVRNAIVAARGEATYNRLMTAIRTFEGGGWREGMSNLEGQDTLGALFGVAVANGLAGNVVSLAVQIPAAIISASKLGMRRWAKAAARLAANPSRVAEIYRDNALVLRRGPVFSRGQLFIALSGKQGNKVAHALIRSGEIPMEALGGMDAAMSAVSGAVAYEAHYSDLKDQLPDQMAKDLALDRMRETIEQTAQPEDFTRKSNLENQIAASRGPLSLVMKGFFLFKSAPRMMSANIITLIKQFKRGEVSAADTADRLIVMVVIYPIIEQVIRSAMKDMMDDDSDEKIWNAKTFAAAIATAPVSGIPLIGNAADAVKMHMIGGHAFAATDPVTRLLEQGKAMTLIGQIADVTQGKREIDSKNLHMAAHVASAVMAATGVPGGAAIETAANIAKTAEGMVKNLELTDEDKDKKYTVAQKKKEIRKDKADAKAAAKATAQ